MAGSSCVPSEPHRGADRLGGVRKFAFAELFPESPTRIRPTARVRPAVAAPEWVNELVRAEMDRKIQSGGPERRPSGTQGVFMRLSTRNQFPGTVISITKGEAMAVVKVAVES